MEPIDLRNETFASLQARLTGLRAAVLATWRRHGPGTTHQLSARSGINILSFRPRTTELLQLGLLELVGRDGTNGIYQAIPQAEMRASFERAKAAAEISAHQMPLKLT